MSHSIKIHNASTAIRICGDTLSFVGTTNRIPSTCRRSYAEHTMDGIRDEKLTELTSTMTKVDPIAHFE